MGGSVLDGVESLFFRARIDAEQGEAAFDEVALDYLAALDAALIGPSRCTRFRRYFAELDRQANLNLLPALVARGELSPSEAASRRRMVLWIVPLLRRRLQARARQLDPRSRPGVPRELRAWVAALSRMQLEIADEFFVRRGTFDLEAFEDAHERFANGELRLRLPSGVWTTQPSSGYHFCFGEFALLALDERVHADRWRPLLNVLIRTQRIFARAYHPATPRKAVFESYRPTGYNPVRAWSITEKRSLAREFALLSPTAIRRSASRHAREYLPGLA